MKYVSREYYEKQKAIVKTFFESIDQSEMSYLKIRDHISDLKEGKDFYWFYHAFEIVNFFQGIYEPNLRIDKVNRKFMIRVKMESAWSYHVDEESTRFKKMITTLSRLPELRTFVKSPELFDEGKESVSEKKYALRTESKVLRIRDQRAGVVKTFKTKEYDRLRPFFFPPEYFSFYISEEEALVSSGIKNPEKLSTDELDLRLAEYAKEQATERILKRLFSSFP